MIIKKKMLFSLGTVLLALTLFSLHAKNNANKEASSNNGFWSSERAETLANAAFDKTNLVIKNKGLLKQIGIQAQKGDKNARFQETLIKYLIDKDYMATLHSEDTTYREELFTYYTPPEPSVLNGFDSARRNASVLLLMADEGHADAAYYILSNLDTYWLELIAPSAELQRAKLIQYSQSAIQGGYRMHEPWANWTLFSSASEFQLPLNHHLTNLSSERIYSVINNGYRFAAINGSLHSALRVAEAYFYGVGYEQDYKQAYAWAKTIVNFYPQYVQRYQQRLSGSASREYLDSVVHYASQIVSLSKEKMDEDQLSEARRLTTDLSENIHYNDRWYLRRDPIPESA